MKRRTKVTQILLMLKLPYIKNVAGLLKTNFLAGPTSIRATSHMRSRVRDHYTSSTLIGGKSGAGPSSLHTALEGPTDYLNARWT
jgi:hypothetical protein